MKPRENLKIEGFLGIKFADIDVNDINIVIGRQASGKSVIAKLAYFFKWLFGTNLIESITANDTTEELSARILKEFESLFPSYSWKDQGFRVQYSFGKVEIGISPIPEGELKIEYSDSIGDFFNHYKTVFDELTNERLKKDKVSTISSLYVNEQIDFAGFIESSIESSSFSFLLTPSRFIPASRSFFAHFQKNIFSLIAADVDLDPLLIDFGKYYEFYKKLHTRPFQLSSRDEFIDNIYGLSKIIIGGRYVYTDGRDWIISGERKVNLSDASSGQQESLPMLITLLSVKNHRGGTMVFIEEPEAHLFPQSQAKIVSIISLIYANLSTKFFITTHSPYILAAFNNLILADTAINKKKTMSQAAFNKLNGPSAPIAYKNISCFTIKDGVVESINDDELELIGGEVLDDVSDHFQHVMNELLLNMDHASDEVA